MNGSRKVIMFLAQLIAVSALVGTGKMSGAELVSLETMAIPVFVAGNFGEYFTKKKEAPVEPVT